MKKLLAIVMVVSLLAFAGGAFAAGHDDATGGHGDYEPENESAKKAYEDASKSAAATYEVATNPSAEMKAAIAKLGANFVLLDAEYFTQAGDDAIEALVDLIAVNSKDVVAFLPPSVIVPDGTATDTVIVIPLTESYAGEGKEDDVYKFNFYPAILTSSSTASDTNMYLMYMNTGTDSFTKMTNDKAGLAAMETGAKVILCFVYDADKGAVKTAADSDPIQTAVTGAGQLTQTERHLSKSGDGGCVAGTSALALAVLGVFVAMRKK